MENKKKKVLLFWVMFCWGGCHQHSFEHGTFLLLLFVLGGKKNLKAPTLWSPSHHTCADGATFTQTFSNLRCNSRHGATCSPWISNLQNKNALDLVEVDWCRWLADFTKAGRAAAAASKWQPAWGAGRRRVSSWAPPRNSWRRRWSCWTHPVDGSAGETSEHLR